MKKFSMAKADVGWIDTTQNGHLPEYRLNNVFTRSLYPRKIQHLPSLEMHYESPRTLNDKHWTDQSLLSYRNVDDYLAESDAFQRASFANIMEKWKEHNKNRTTDLIASLDSHYNMKLRFRRDKELTRASEMKYASGASYHRFIGNESNPKNVNPCQRHKRRVQEYEQRHVQESLKLPTIANSRSEPYVLSKRTKLSSIDSSILFKSSEFGDQLSNSDHTFS